MRAGIEDVERQVARLFADRFESVRRVVETVPESRLFVPVAPGTASVGALALTAAELLEVLVGRCAGDRAATNGDADERRPLPRAEVLRRLDAARETVETVLPAIDAKAFAEAPHTPHVDGESRGDHALRALEDFSFHAGQIAFLGKVHEAFGRHGPLRGPEPPEPA